MEVLKRLSYPLLRVTYFHFSVFVGSGIFHVSHECTYNLFTQIREKNGALILPGFLFIYSPVNPLSVLVQLSKLYVWCPIA